MHKASHGGHMGSDNLTTDRERTGSVRRPAGVVGGLTGLTPRRLGAEAGGIRNV